LYKKSNSIEHTRGITHDVHKESILDHTKKLINNPDMRLTDNLHKIQDQLNN
jgi:hypothetical protein